MDLVSIGFSIIAIILAIVAIIISFEMKKSVEKGATGSTGPPGPTGPKGPIGQAGSPGVWNYQEISGTVTISSLVGNFFIHNNTGAITIMKDVNLTPGSSFVLYNNNSLPLTVFAPGYGHPSPVPLVTIPQLGTATFFATEPSGLVFSLGVGVT